MPAAVLLIILGALSRLVPHPPNAVAIGALALYAAARLPRVWAFVVPVAAMVLSDIIIDYGYGHGAFPITRLTIYATKVLIVALGRLPRANAGPMVRASMSLVASTLFFLTTNFALWATDPISPYARTWGGLASCYTAAIPFFGNALMADLTGTAFLFTLDHVIQVYFHKSTLPATGPTK
jgi:hypothetical protein